MSDLTTAEQQAQDALAALEGRVTVDEQALRDAKDAIQKELDAKTAAGDAGAIAFLTDLKAKMDAFQPAPATGTATGSTAATGAATAPDAGATPPAGTTTATGTPADTTGGGNAPAGGTPPATPTA